MLRSMQPRSLLAPATAGAAADCSGGGALDSGRELGRTYVSHRYHYAMESRHVKLNAATADILPGWFPSIGDVVADKYTDGESFVGVASTKLVLGVTLHGLGTLAL